MATELYTPNPAGTRGSVWAPGGPDEIDGVCSLPSDSSMSAVSGMFFLDNFTGADGTEIQAHSADEDSGSGPWANNGAVPAALIQGSLSGPVGSSIAETGAISHTLEDIRGFKIRLGIFTEEDFTSLIAFNSSNSSLSLNLVQTAGVITVQGAYTSEGDFTTEQYVLDYCTWYTIEVQASVAGSNLRLIINDVVRETITGFVPDMPPQYSFSASTQQTADNTVRIASAQLYTRSVA